MKRHLCKNLLVASLLLAWLLAISNFWIKQDTNGEYACSNNYHNEQAWRVKSFNKALATYLLRKNSKLEVTYVDEDSWIEVTPNLLVYSAFLEEVRRGTRQIRLIGVVPKSDIGRRNSQIDCWIDVGNSTFYEAPRFEPIPEDHNLRYTAAFILCPINFLGEVTQLSTLRVAVVPRKYFAKPKWLNVHRSSNRPGELCSICVRPVIEAYDDLALVAEFIGYHTSVGVGRFDIYLCNASRQLEVFLSLLQKETGTLIRLHRWNLYMDSSSLQQYGQLAALQDCIYRSRITSGLVIYLDFDEFVVPKTKPTVVEAIDSVEASVEKGAAGSFVIRNQFFCSEYPYGLAPLLEQPPMLTRIRTVREAIPWEYHERSKYVGKPNAIATGGIHFVWKHVPGHREVEVDDRVMVLNHYRACCGLSRAGLIWWNPTLAEMTVVDMTLRDRQINVLNSRAFIFLHSLFQESAMNDTET